MTFIQNDIVINPRTIRGVNIWRIEEVYEKTVKLTNGVFGRIEDIKDLELVMDENKIPAVISPLSVGDIVTTEENELFEIQHIDRSKGITSIPLTLYDGERTLVKYSHEVSKLVSVAARKDLLGKKIHQLNQEEILKAKEGVAYNPTVIGLGDIVQIVSTANHGKIAKVKGISTANTNNIQLEFGTNSLTWINESHIQILAKKQFVTQIPLSKIDNEVSKGDLVLSNNNIIYEVIGETDDKTVLVRDRTSASRRLSFSILSLLVKVLDREDLKQIGFKHGDILFDKDGDQIDYLKFVKYSDTNKPIVTTGLNLNQFVYEGDVTNLVFIGKQFTGSIEEIQQHDIVGYWQNKKDDIHIFEVISVDEETGFCSLRNGNLCRSALMKDLKVLILNDERNDLEDIPLSKVRQIEITQRLRMENENLKVQLEIERATCDSLSKNLEGLERMLDDASAKKVDDQTSSNKVIQELRAQIIDLENMLQISQNEVSRFADLYKYQKVIINNQAEIIDRLEP